MAAAAPPPRPADLLRDLQLRIRGFARPRVQGVDYRMLKLRAQQVALDPTGLPSNDFPFFAPYQGVMPNVDENRMGTTFLDRGRVPRIPLTALDYAMELADYFLHYTSLCRLDGYPTWSLKSILDFNFDWHLHENIPVRWEVIKVSDQPNNQYPHTMCYIIHGLDGNDHLLRAELLAVTRIMAGRLKRRAFRAHSKAPVLMFSFMGPKHVRLVHAYFDIDEDKLYVNYTPLYDFETRNAQALQLLARWSLATPAGNTR
ncbi:hypothetical protein B7463_g10578, partial [Scytalidium lignicola]